MDRKTIWFILFLEQEEINVMFTGIFLVTDLTLISIFRDIYPIPWITRNNSVTT